MAAYAALVSLMYTIKQIEHHPFLPISLDQKQLESLKKNVTSLQELLERYNSPFGDCEESDKLEIRIADAAYAAEDAIESYIVDAIHLAGSTTARDQEKASCYQGLEQVIQEMDLIKIEVVKEKRVPVQIQLERDDVPKNSMVGFDDVLKEVVEKLNDNSPGRQVIPIVGMGGIGKTTLAKSIFTKEFGRYNFDICVWATISKVYNIREILIQLIGKKEKDFIGVSEDDLKHKLYQDVLYDKRYLIVLDDMWSIEFWNNLKPFFPDQNKRSRIIVTTRFGDLVSNMKTSDYICNMKFLDEGSSWSLFSEIVFGEKGCHNDQLEEIGRNIANNCKGLPLSIVVIGGLLASSQHTEEHWKSIRDNLNSIVNSNNDEYCLRLLKMSYTELPAHLRPCFLYMGVFEEDSSICVSNLAKLWAAEGFLKPKDNLSLETVAKEYLKGLIDRNLVLVDELGLTGNMKRCKIHDLLRDLSLREALKERFYHVIRQDSPQGIDNQRRIVVPEGSGAFRSSLARSIICDDQQVQSPSNFRLLRVFKAYEKYSERRDEYLLESMFHGVNLRYLAIAPHEKSKFPSSVKLLWNLHTLIVDHSGEAFAPVEFWNMAQLRNVEFVPCGLHLPAPSSREGEVIMENLETLTGVENLNLSEEVVKRIPNVKKLRISYDAEAKFGSSSYYNMSNLERLQKLESFYCSSTKVPGFLRKLKLPLSLKKLYLEADDMDWNEMLKRIASFPNLEKLQLFFGSFEEDKWKTVEGQFPSLKFLKLFGCYGLKCWKAKSSHFPCLEQLALCNLKELKRIPSGTGEIPTLKSIVLANCDQVLSLVKSAEKIIEDIMANNGKASLQVRVTIWKGEGKEAVVSELPKHQNIHVEVI